MRVDKTRHDGTNRGANRHPSGDAMRLGKPESRVAAMMKTTRGNLGQWPCVLTCMLAVASMPGCGSSQWLINGFIDPTQVGQFNETRKNEIRSTIGLLEEPKGIQNAVDPSDTDLRPDFSERRIGSGDTVEISIFELTTP